MRRAEDTQPSRLHMSQRWLQHIVGVSGCFLYAKVLLHCVVHCVHHSTSARTMQTGYTKRVYISLQAVFLKHLPSTSKLITSCTLCIDSFRQLTAFLTLDSTPHKPRLCNLLTNNCLVLEVLLCHTCKRTAKVCR